MFNYIPITYLNDFIFCPRSIYFHQLCEDQDVSLYHRQAQTNGKLKHKTIENNSYSSKKNILQGISVYCEKYNLAGRIDLFDIQKHLLIERKTKIKEIYDGYVFQVYAQFFALEEMGYIVRQIRLYSYEDNKCYTIPLPTENFAMLKKFEATIEKLKNFDMNDKTWTVNTKKCVNCIYEPMCDVSIC